jgi:hypothetical protein
MVAHGKSSRSRRNASCRMTIRGLASRIQWDGWMDPMKAHRMERFDFRVPDIIVEFEQTREYVREALSAPCLCLRRRHVIIYIDQDASSWACSTAGCSRSRAVAPNVLPNHRATGGARVMMAAEESRAEPGGVKVLRNTSMGSEDALCTWSAYSCSHISK